MRGPARTRHADNRSATARLRAVIRACALLGLATPAHASAAGLTYAGDAEPILRARCATCHVRGGVASRVDFSSWEGYPAGTGVVAWLPEIARVVATGEMPPTLPAEGHAPLVSGGAMTSEERWTILTWLAEGGDRGPAPFDENPADGDGAKDEVETAEERARRWLAGPPEIILTPPGGKQLMLAVPGADPAPMEHELTLPDPVGELLIQGWEIQPGPGAAAIASVRLWMSPADGSRHLLAQWNPGAQGAFYPPHTARAISPGTRLLLEITHAPAAGRIATRFSDPPRVGLYLAREAPLRVQTAHLTATDGSASIAFERAGRVLAVYPQGEDCRSLSLAVEGDAGTRELIRIPGYDSSFEAPWRFDPPVRHPADTRLALRAEGRAEVRVEFVADPSLPGETTDELNALVTRLEEVRAAELERIAEPSPDKVLSWEEMRETASVFYRNAKKSPSRIAVVASHHDPAPPEAEKIWWCPQRAECGVRDYEAPGECAECGRELVLKSGWLAGETARTGEPIASVIGEWRLTAAGTPEEYLCPNRGDGWHRDRVYAKPDLCGICGARFVHRSRFERVPEFVCTTWGCRSFFDPAAESRVVYRTRGLCPDCGTQVQPYAHMDHSPVHGGQLMMAANGFHHVEATLPPSGGVRVYVYDDYKQPIDARNFAGRLIVEELGADGVVIERRTEMEAAGGGAFLFANPPEGIELPAEVALEVDLAGMPFRFHFLFEEHTAEAQDAPEQTAEPDPATLSIPHGHGHAPIEPVVVPEAPADIAREILIRRAAVRAALEAGDFGALEAPARDAADLAQGLVERLSGPAGEGMTDRAARIDAARRLRRAATAIVHYSHLSNRERIYNMGWTPMERAAGDLVPLASDAD